MGINKRSQTEIMGLVVIVLLLSIAILFVVMFFMRAEEESPQEAFTQEQTPHNMINAILETDSGCRGTKMRDLFKDCYVSESIVCEGTGSCEFLNKTLMHIFNETLNKWKIEYEFGVPDSGLPKIGGCPPGPSRAGTYFLPTELGRPMEIYLALCGKG